MPDFRFDGVIAGFGSASGVRVVLGIWPHTPFGPVTDAMVETPTGHRVLVAPTDEVARFIAATYRFDELRLEPTRLTTEAGRWRFDSDSLQVELRPGRRTPTGTLLTLIPRRLATSRGWCRALDPVVRRVRPGVRTAGTAGAGREEWYGALDEHRVSAVRGHWLGAPLGELRSVTPPVRFGFGSTPTRPSVVRVVSTVRTG